MSHSLPPWQRWLNVATNLFPVWIIIGAVLALIHPPLFSWGLTTQLGGASLIVWGLAVIMLAMGMTLEDEDFRSLVHLPKAAGLGLIAQFAIMPSLGWLIGKVFQLPTPFAVGLVLVGCCPGGTASNVIAFLAKANLALSVLMTTCSTLVAIALTPLLTSGLAGEYIPVDAWGLFFTTLRVVLIPILLGVVLKRVLPKLVDKILPVAPLMAVLAIVLICSAIFGVNRASILDAKWQLLGSVFTFHGLGFLLGYGVPRALGMNTMVNRTIAIEVGMQNSGLAVVLAGKHFANPLTAVPGAISAVTHSILGSILAYIWRTQSVEPSVKGHETPQV